MSVPTHGRGAILVIFTTAMKGRNQVHNLLRNSEAKRDLIILLFLSAVLKISIALFTLVINRDGVLYITAAQKLAEGNFKESLGIYGMPLYPLLIALIHYVIPNWIAAARLISIVASILTIIPLYLLTNEIFYRKAALWACFAFALSPLSNHLSVEVLRNPLFLFFLAWATYFAHRAIKSNKLIYFLLSSLLCLFSILCRIEGLVLYIFYIIFIFYLFLRNPKARRPLFKGALIYIALPFSLFALGYLLLAGGLSPSFNRMDEVIQRLKELLNLDFLNNYKLIYNRLKTLEITITGKDKVQNLIEITRHYMHTIYLIGLLESFIKAIFPLYLIPLIIGFWHARNRNGAFVILLAGCYLLLSYYFLISMDSIRTRFLFTPAFLLYPWIGMGMDRISTFVNSSSRPRLLTIVLVLLFGILPIYRSVDFLWKQDPVVIKAGEWIGRIPELQTVEVMTMDTRVPFYAGLEGHFTAYGYSDFVAMEEIAKKKKVDLIIIKRSIKKKTPGPEFKSFTKVKEFVGLKNIVDIYCSPRLHKAIRGKK